MSIHYIPISIMFHLPILLPAAALLHIGQWAISRKLDSAHRPICWAHPPTLLKSDLPSSFVFIDFVLLHILLLVNCVNSYFFSFNYVC